MKAAVAVGSAVSNLPGTSEACSEVVSDEPPFVHHRVALVVLINEAQVISGATPVLLVKGNLPHGTVQTAGDVVGAYVIHAVAADISILRELQIELADVVIDSLVDVVSPSTNHWEAAPGGPMAPPRP